jgi:hypothetical protein
MLKDHVRVECCFRVLSVQNEVRCESKKREVCGAD